MLALHETHSRRPVASTHQVLVVATESTVAEHARIVPLLAGKIAQGGRATAYVCEGRICQLPTTDVATFQSQLAAGFDGRHER